ncbi:hypothetical protein AWZ03_006380 [Drosophila navojoa]|uniref:Uncharacterized protein n=1 Tax=Drosophila navojoa TaxID=7232 RepID=A0A484BEU1_DRONA|nr:hypothetical protein AWZ03_006380 [Drosophila navojoa]
MISNAIIISCAVLAIIFVAYLPLGDAVTCTVEPDNVDCVDCLDPINIENAECIAEDYEYYEDDDDALATRRPPSPFKQSLTSTAAAATAAADIRQVFGFWLTSILVLL